MSSKVTYRQQYTRCGKERCRKCKDGAGHGPYWYAYWSENGRTISKYVGIRLPEHVEIERQHTKETEDSQETSPVEPQLITPTKGNSSPSHRSSDVPSQLPTQLLRVYVLGQFRVDRLQDNEWQTVVNRTWRRRRARALLACLLSQPVHRMGREQAMEALWPNLDMGTAANRLNGAVHELRQILEPQLARPATSHMLRLERDVLELADRSQIWIDAEAFESLLNEANSIGIQSTNDIESHKSLNQAQAEQIERLLEEAAALYSGDYLLEELYSEWAAPRREALRRSWTGLLLKLAELREARNTLAAAMEPLNRLLATDPTDETAVQRLMLLLTRLDRRGEALNTYRRLATRLQHNYDSEPLPETRDLYEKLRQGHSIKASQPKLLIANSVNESEIGTCENPGLLTLPPQPQSMPTASDKALPHVFTTFVSTSQLGRYNQSPLVGRVGELDTMRQILHSLQEIPREALPLNTGNGNSVLAGKMRKPHVLLLMGEAGIGKTRLAEELSHEAKTHGWAVAWTRAYEQEGAVPYRPWIELLRTLLKHVPAEVLVSNVGVRPDEGAFTNLPYTPTILERLSTLLPELRDLLPPNERTSPQLPLEQERLHLWEATLGLLSTLSKTTPLLLVLDDLHWTDGSSRELLAYLTRHMQDQRILLLATCRDVELAPGHGLRSLIADLRREQTIYTLAIQPLTQAQIGSLVAHLPQNIVQSIQTQAAGNPFFAEELARVSETIQAVSPYAHYAERGMLAHTSTYHNEGGREVSPSGSTLPEGITAVLDRRLSHLSSECQALLAKASVLGGSFEFSQLLFMANEHHEDTILDLLEEALRAGLLTEEGTGARITYHFWHPLIVSHLYERLSAARCAQLHRRAANALLHIYQGHEEEVAPAITHHLSKGGAGTAQIAYYAELTGTQAYSLINRSLELAERMSNLPIIALTTGNLGEMAARAGDMLKAEEWLRRSLAISEHTNELEHQCWANIALAVALQNQGDLQGATAGICRSLAIARAMKSARNIGGALIALADLRVIQAIIACQLQNSNLKPGIVQLSSTCTRLLLRAKSTVLRAMQFEGLESELVVEGQVILAGIYFLLNDLETAQKEAVRAMEASEKHELTRMLARAYRLLGRILSAQGEHEKADPYFENALQIFRDYEFRLDYARALHSYAETLLQRGHPGECTYKKGLDHLQKAHTIFAECHAAIDLEWTNQQLASYKSETVEA